MTCIAPTADHGARVVLLESLLHEETESAPSHHELIKFLKQSFQREATQVLRKYYYWDLVKNKPSSFLEIPTEFHSDYDIVFTAVQRIPSHLTLVKDREIVMRCMTSSENQCLSLYSFLGTEFKLDVEIASIALKICLNDYKSMASSLRSNADLALQVVRQNGLLLELVHKTCRMKNRMVQITALEQNGMALQFLSHELKNTYELALTAVTQNGAAIQFISRELKKRDEIITAALNSNTRAYYYLHPTLRLKYAEERGDLTYPYDDIFIRQRKIPYIVCNDRPCQVVRKTYSRWFKKCHIDCKDIFTGETLTLNYLTPQSIVHIPFIWTFEYFVEYIEGDEVVLTQRKTLQVVSKKLSSLFENSNSQLFNELTVKNESSNKIVKIVKSMGIERVVDVLMDG
ncbi:hypothetical protein C9374_002258 [Naegleria lovaniensis]|uniref:DUF4116 domain-containing protein n=1 Tax=Naegleria lovaniensis TaxID=51637 RepID=A0AA88KM32_NAELO|nr:uncharacterized protein C9374_002258 [Naegleria lovaniensis]KAG2386514.1 hypothetical protein C9374_002258 [Naegleria lovaniensis]